MIFLILTWSNKWLFIMIITAKESIVYVCAGLMYVYMQAKWTAAIMQEIRGKNYDHFVVVNNFNYMLSVTEFARWIWIYSGINIWRSLCSCGAEIHRKSLCFHPNVAANLKRHYMWKVCFKNSIQHLFEAE